MTWSHAPARLRRCFFPRRRGFGLQMIFQLVKPSPHRVAPASGMLVLNGLRHILKYVEPTNPTTTILLAATLNSVFRFGDSDNRRNGRISGRPRTIGSRGRHLYAGYWRHLHLCESNLSNRHKTLLRARRCAYHYDMGML